MRFVHPGTMVQQAAEGGYAVPALNTNGASYDLTRAALEAAQEMQSPLILQVYEPNCSYRGFDYFVQLARFLCDELQVTVPVALQLDHGHSYASVLQAMRAGFTSVMFDASHEPVEENIRLSADVRQVATALGVALEAEVGYVKGNEPPKEEQIGRVPVPEKPTIPPSKTTPGEVRRFLEGVAVDMLAVSVGTTHGVYQSQSEIDFDLLAQLSAASSVPLVQHGTSGISLEDLSRLARGGMSKINFGEPFRYDYIRYFTELTDSLEHLWHPWRVQKEIKNRIKENMKTLIDALGASGRGTS